MPTTPRKVGDGGSWHLCLPPAEVEWASQLSLQHLFTTSPCLHISSWSFPPPHMGLRKGQHSAHPQRHPLLLKLLPPITKRRHLSRALGFQPNFLKFGGRLNYKDIVVIKLHHVPPPYLTTNPSLDIQPGEAFWCTQKLAHSSVTLWLFAVKGLWNLSNQEW